MQSYIKNGSDWVSGAPVVGQPVRFIDAHGNVDESLAYIDPDAEPIEPNATNSVALSNFVIKSDSNIVAAVANIHSLPTKSSLDILATVHDGDGALAAMLAALDLPKARMTVMAERVRGGNVLDVIDDVRFDMFIDATSLTITSVSGFEMSGNYVVTQARMNKGLIAVGTPFEIEMPMLEFDVINT